MVYFKGGLVQRGSVRFVGRRYIQTFESGFDEGLRDVQLSFMQSDGGLTPVSRFSGHKAILSGPAGGCARVARRQHVHDLTSLTGATVKYYV